MLTKKINSEQQFATVELRQLTVDRLVDIIQVLPPDIYEKIVSSLKDPTVTNKQMVIILQAAISDQMPEIESASFSTWRNLVISLRHLVLGDIQERKKKIASEQGKARAKLKPEHYDLLKTILNENRNEDGTRNYSAILCKLRENGINISKARLDVRIAKIKAVDPDFETEGITAIQFLLKTISTPDDHNYQQINLIIRSDLPNLTIWYKIIEIIISNGIIVPLESYSSLNELSKEQIISQLRKSFMTEDEIIARQRRLQGGNRTTMVMGFEDDEG